MAKKKPAKKATKKKPAKKATKKSACKVLTVCGKRRRICWGKKKNGRRGIVSNKPA